MPLGAKGRDEQILSTKHVHILDCPACMDHRWVRLTAALLKSKSTVGQFSLAIGSWGYWVKKLGQKKMFVPALSDLVLDLELSLPGGGIGEIELRWQPRGEGRR